MAEGGEEERSADSAGKTVCAAAPLHDTTPLYLPPGPTFEREHAQLTRDDPTPAVENTTAITEAREWDGLAPQTVLAVAALLRLGACVAVGALELALPYWLLAPPANIGGEEGCFENLEVYCGMAFDKKENVTSLCSDGEDDSLLVWNKETIAILKQRKGSLKENQLLAVSYLWELCYDLLLAKHDNVSASPGFEALGLRPN